jgi:hypothetical protein
VNMDGDIYGASCRQGGKLGNIYEDFDTSPLWPTCARKSCSCGADLFIAKSRTANGQNLLLKTHSSDPRPEMRRLVDPAKISAMERTHASDLKQVYWEIGRRCNYDCSYCWPNIHNKTDRHKTLAELVAATEKVILKFAKGSRVNFIISGGEPTLNPDFLEWVRYISKSGHYLSMHSNGTRLPDYYSELIRYGDLNLSAHFESFVLEKFVKVVTAVVSKKVENGNVGVGHLEVKIMMGPGVRPRAIELRDRLLSIPDFAGYCTWAFVPIRNGKLGDQIMDGYSEEDFKLFGAGA